MSEVITYLPELAAGVAYAAGLAVDHVAARHGDAKREAVLHTFGATEGEFQAARRGNRVMEPAQAQTVQSRGKFEKARTSLQHKIPLSMALAAGLVAAAFG